jgi:SPP1 gp7 family putative phage head morphogenesis protein
MTPRVAQMVDAGAAESAGLISSIPSKYLQQVQGDVMRSITSGNGLQDLVPALQERNVKTLNWAANVAKDQTRKVYNNINKARMQDAGVNKFEWIHSGGSNKPRKYHLDHAPAGLNGGIFDFNDPPIIDENTGERGIPGQLPYCGCTMRPIIDLSNED